MNKTIENIRKKVLASDSKICTTKIYQYWIDGSGHLKRARKQDLDSMEMYKESAIETLD